jgi:hypothetical protein
VTYDKLKIILLATLQEEYIKSRQETSDMLDEWERKGLTADEAFKIISRVHEALGRDFKWI